MLRTSISVDVGDRQRDSKRSMRTWTHMMQPQRRRRNEVPGIKCLPSWRGLVVQCKYSNIFRRTRTLQFHNGEHHYGGQGHKHVRKRIRDYSRRTVLTHRDGALFPMPSCLGIGGTLVGPGKDTHGTPVPTVERPWVVHNKLIATPPTRQNQGYRDTHRLPTW